jgi:hypothetical protein
MSFLAPRFCMVWLGIGELMTACSTFRILDDLGHLFVHKLEESLIFFSKWIGNI